MLSRIVLDHPLSLLCACIALRFLVFLVVSLGSKIDGRMIIRKSLIEGKQHPQFQEALQIEIAENANGNFKRRVVVDIIATIGFSFFAYFFW